MSAAMGTSQNNTYLSSENAKIILADLLSAFNSPENATRLEEARDSAGNDMLKMMQFVFPLAAEIQMDIIKNYGFSRDGKGATQFALAVKTLEKDDSEIANLNNKLRSYFIPSMIQSQSAAVQSVDQCTQ